MKKIYNTLIIDDHPLIIEAYKSALKNVSDQKEDVKFNISIAKNCDVASNKMNASCDDNEFFDLVFLDIRLPASKDKKYLSGEDIGLKLKQICPETKIIVSTTFNDNYRLHSILTNVSPEGLLIKNDITAKELVIAISLVISGSLYYSKTVLKLVQKTFNNDFVLDKMDRMLLYQLSIGTKVKDLPEIIPLSLAGVEKRKRQIKELFNLKTNDDKELINTAKEKGFI